VPITIRAVYEGGVLRPVQPLALDEGEVVEVTVAKAQPAQTALRPPTPEEEDYARRLTAAATLDEMFAVMDTAPRLPKGYDLSEALNANRKATGERLLFPEPEDERTP
jgi:predicted DNA-binding antitoxin AbrB/MazE fold protein